MATLEAWRLPRKLRCSTSRITTIVKAIPALQLTAHRRDRDQQHRRDPSIVPDVKVTYDKTANAAYIYFTDPQVSVRSAHTYPCDPIDVDGKINLDFDEQGRLIGIEVLAATSKLTEYVLQAAERLDSEGS